MPKSAIKFGTLARLAMSTSLLALSATAHAQSESNTPQGGDPEIIVTARQRSESLQNVPASITAFVSSEIKTANITRPADFIAMTSGVSQVQTVEVGDMQINIRGINSGRDTESSVALVIDGVLVTNPNALNRELDNISQIEVLKGPQGAIYGRNALAGAIILTTKKPGDHFEGSIKAGYGKNNQWEVAGSISGPLGPNLRGSISAYHHSDDGSFYNSFQKCGDCENFQRDTGVTGRLIADLGGNNELDFKAHYSKIKAGGVTFNASLALVDAAAYYGSLGSPTAYLFQENANDHNFVYINKNRPDNQQENINFSLKGTFDLGFGTLTATGTYNSEKNYFLVAGTSNGFGLYNANTQCLTEYNYALAHPDYAPVPAPFFYTPNIANSFLPPYPPLACGGYQYQQRDQKDYSGEFRLQSKGGEKLDWMIGVYYAHVDRHLVVSYGGDKGLGQFNKGLVLADGPNPTDLYYDDNLISNVYAGFANVNYKIFDNLELALAGRYDREDRKAINNVPKINPQSQGFGAGGFPVCGPGGLYTNEDGSCNYYINPYYNVNPGANSIPSREKSFEQFQPKVTLNYKPTPDVSLYASYGYGFRSGGFNSSGTAATLNLYYGGLHLDNGTPNINIPTDDFKKEVSKAAEVGFKAKLFDNTLSHSGALYYTIDRNGQDFSFFAGPFGSLRVVTSIDKSEIKGLEFDFKWRPTQNLKIYGGFGYTDTKIKAYTARPYTVGNKLPYIPEYTGNAGVEYTLPFGGSGISLVTRVDESFIGKTWFSPVQDNRLPNAFTAFGFGEGNFSKQYRAPYAVTNLNMTLQGGSWDLSAWCTNLFNKKFLAEIIPAPEFGGSFIHDSYGRTFGVRASYRFGGN